MKAGATEPRTGINIQRERVICAVMGLTACDAQLKEVLASNGLGATLAGLETEDGNVQINSRSFMPTKPCST